MARYSRKRRKRRIRKATHALIALLLLAALVFGIWILVLDKNAPLNKYLAERYGNQADVTGELTTDPEKTDGTTVEPEPTEEATEEPTVEPTEEPTAETTEEPTEEPTAEVTSTPVLELTVEPTPAPTPEATEEAKKPVNTLVKPAKTAAVTATPAPTQTPEPTATPEPTPVPEPVELELPYYIEVDRGMQVVRVYTIGEDGYYSLLAREMICSTDCFGYKPPNGVYALDGQKMRWMESLANSVEQYATRISGHILFHSLPYSNWYANTLQAEEYKKLGTDASIGCVRLLCIDAKWIYDNVPAGTPVRFMTGERDEEKLAELAPPPLKSGKYDPTDPREDNPDYDPSYELSKPEVTPALGVTPAPTEPWTPDVYGY